MFGPLTINELPLSLSFTRRKVENFLISQGLRPEPLDRYFGISDPDGNLIGGGGLQGNVVKCIALSEATRGESVSNSLVSRIAEAAREEGHDFLFIFTKPENEGIFGSLAFRTVGRAAKAILMENNPRGISSYTDRLRKIAASVGGEKRGVIVMNCNPLTKGHRYLIETAASQVDHLFIIPVMEGDSEYSYDERVAMIEATTVGIANVTVCPGSAYSVSKATFPTYFLKDLNDASKTHIDLDLDIFSTHVAPALGASVRFVGTEPTDALTEEYNARMKRSLPERGIEIVEVDRLCQSDAPVSASRVRKLTDGFRAGEALPLVSPVSVPWVLAHAAARSLEAELALTPKPGLVDMADSGSHTDMDFELMQSSIRSLTPYFARLASLGTDSLPSHDDIVRLGIEAEKAMLAATGGVNTHRGALFSLGLTLIAASRLFMKEGRIEASALQSSISALAEGFGSDSDSHGSEARRKYGLKGASDLAREGYDTLFADWLPFYRSKRHLSEARHLLLLRIMSEIDDTNVYHRGGAEGAAYVKEEARKLLDGWTEAGMADANRKFIERNLSPGGAADMLALTLLVDSLCGNI